jgi:hypothetical protein
MARAYKVVAQRPRDVFWDGGTLCAGDRRGHVSQEVAESEASGGFDDVREKLAEWLCLDMSIRKTDLVLVPLVIRACVEVENVTKAYEKSVIDVLEALILLSLSPWPSHAGKYLIE